MRLRIAITAILVLWTSLMVVHSANVANVTGGEGKPGDRVEIAVELATDATDAVAAEIRVPLPDGVKPVEGSFVPNSERIPMHTVTADFNGNEYVIVVFNTSLSPIPTGNGELAHFTVELGENPGIYDITPKVKLSGAAGSAIAVTATGGTLSVLAPRIELVEDEVDFGRVPIRSSVRRNVTVSNTGTTNLAIDQFTTNIEGLSANLPGILGAGESGVMELVYSPTQRSKSVSGRITPQSNSVGKAPFIAIKSVPFSVNELHVGNASGICNEEVEMSVRMNNMEPITGVEFTIQLPEELDFVEGSLKKSSRADALSAESYVDGNKRLRIVLFGLAQKPISGEDGELLKFNLLLRGRTGSYRLNPDKVILANAGGENMTSATSAGSVSISSPALYCNSEMALGDLPLSGTNQFSHNISNNGTAPLTISKVTFLNDIAECASQLPIVIAPNQTAPLNIAIKEPKFGEFATTMNIYSNDPDNELKTVNVSGNFYSPNELSFAGKFAEGKFFIETSLSNEAQIAALQMDVVCPDGVTTDENLLVLSERASQHSATIAKVGNNRYRIVIFSLKNIPFTGNDGILFSLGLEGDCIAGKQIRVENIKLSSVDGVNFTTPDSEVKLGNMPVPVSEITLSTTSASLKVSEKVQIKATITPQNATNKEVKWSSSDEAVASVDESGLVTAHALGAAIITASAVDGSGVKSECEITVVPTPAESISLDKTEVSLKATESVTLSVTVAPETTTDKTVAWSSSDDNVAIVDDNGKVTAVAVGEATVTATAASGVKAECKVTVVPTPAESISLDKTEVSLKATESVTLSATIAPETTTDKTVTWSSSNDNVATVDDNGKVTAVAVGEAIITATAASGVKAECKVTVVPTPAESIVLDKIEVSLKATESVTLSATVAPETTTDKTVTWSSSDDNVATVDDSGKVTAVTVGEAIITATAASGVKAECKVTVVPTPAESIVLDKIEVSLKATESVTLSATVAPETTTDKTVTWNSSDENVATVDESGKVTAVAVGEATVTATAALGVKAECKVTVVPTPAESISLDKTEVSLKATESVTLSATIAPETTTDKTATWSSSDDNVAIVDDNGKVTAVAVGEATVTVTAASGVKAECKVTVVPTPAESISLDKTEVSLKATESVTLSATVAPETTTDKTVAWSSSDDNVATVDDNGKVTAVAIGEAIITATAASGVKAECKVTVVPTPAESISLDKTEVSLKATESVTLSATVAPETTTDKTVTWSSSDGNVATVDDNGKVTAVAVGEAIITATAASGVKAECKVTVVPTPAESISLDKTEVSLKATESVTLSATIAPETTTDKTVTWSSSDDNVATVDESGKVTALTVGEAIITATATSGVKAECKVTVVPTPAESVIIEQDDTELRVGDERQFTAVVYPKTATDKTISWTSSDEAVITVTSDGLIKAVGIGIAEVTASTSNGISDMRTVTVKAPLATSIILDQSEISAYVGEEVWLKALILPTEAADQEVEWSSSNEMIATVDNNGKVTIVAVGQTVITARTTDGSNLSAECAIFGTSGILGIYSDAESTHNIYNINGHLLKHKASCAEFMQMPKGLYIVDGKKVYKK